MFHDTKNLPEEKIAGSDRRKLLEKSAGLIFISDVLGSSFLALGVKMIKRVLILSGRGKWDKIILEPSVWLSLGGENH